LVALTAAGFLQKLQTKGLIPIMNNGNYEKLVEQFGGKI
jgi:hypothetical protein